MIAAIICLAVSIIIFKIIKNNNFSEDTENLLITICTMFFGFFLILFVGRIALFINDSSYKLIFDNIKKCFKIIMSY